MSPPVYDWDAGEYLTSEEERMIDELEAMLRPPVLPMAPYPAKAVLLASGETMVVRQASVDEVDTMLEVIQPLSWLTRDFYDIVAARLFAELLGWKTHRVRNEYCLVGVIDGVLAGIVNGRLFDEKHGVSYHTLTLKRGLRVRLAPVRLEDGAPHRVPGPGRGLDRGREPDRPPPLDDRVPARPEVRGPARAGRRAVVGADPRHLLQGQVAAGDRHAPGLARAAGEVVPAAQAGPARRC